ncbi:MAG: hypothetical protein BV459_00250 [Thermoplasmata archaeon M11B2D]|nr:MAG: hypothetical protein BV459_00250 [Thermoplasmata archaeon M11B2D]
MSNNQNGSLSDRLVSILVKNQLPEFVRFDYPTFVAFLEAYYEWMELTGNVIERSQCLENYLDVDTTIDDFITAFKKDYLTNVPEKLFSSHVNQDIVFVGGSLEYEIDYVVTDSTNITVYADGIKIPPEDYSISSVGGACASHKFVITLDGAYIGATEIKVNIQEDAEVNDAQLIKNIIEFYRARGTEKSFKLLFRILFNQDIEILYPKENILKWSDGKWLSDETSIRVTTETDVDGLLYRQVNIVEYNPILGQDQLIGKASVERISKRSLGKYYVADLFLTNIIGTIKPANQYFNIAGTIKPNVRVVADFKDINGVDVHIEESIYPVLTAMDVTVAGASYNVSNTFTIPDDKTYALSYKVRNSSGHPLNYVFSLGLSANLITADVDVSVNSIPLVAGVDYTVSGDNVTFVNGLSYNDVVDFWLIATGAKCSIKKTDGAGAIQKIKVEELGVGYIDGYIVNITSIGDGNAQAVTSDGARFLYDGRYINVDGHLSERTMRLQDGFYYQQYSYVIKSSLSVDQYADAVKRLVHPAGMKMFGQLTIESCASAATNFCKFYVDDETSSVIQIVSGNSPWHGPTWESFDYIMKFRFPENYTGSGTYPTQIEYFEDYDVDTIESMYPDSVQYATGAEVEIVIAVPPAP